MPEIISPITLAHKRSLASFPDAKAMYEFAGDHAAKWRSGEIRRCLREINIARQHVDEHRFMREYLWCVYVSGFSAKTISNKYAALLRAHKIENFSGRYEPIAVSNIVRDFSGVYSVFKNRTKAAAVQETRGCILEQTWPWFFREFVEHRDPSELDGLPNIGPALARHLARNLGNLNICKPDVHLNRLAKHYGYEDAERLCLAVSSDPVGKTDMILWFASVDHGTN